MNRSLSDGAIYLMRLLMTDETIENKVRNANSEKEGKTYVDIDVRKNGIVILGETKYRFWNKLIGCQFKLTFEKWALVVWDALLDLSKGPNSKALEEGLSTEIAKRAQRSGDYEWVVKRLYDCYEHVCNNKQGGASSEGDRGDKGLSMTERTVYCNGEPVTININAQSINKTLKFPDATGRAFLNFDIGVTGIRVNRN